MDILDESEDAEVVDSLVNSMPLARCRHLVLRMP